MLADWGNVDTMGANEHMSRSQRKARNELLEHAQAALEQDSTRYLLRWIMDQCGLFESSFTGNSQTFFNEGRREVGLEIIGLLNEIDPHQWVRLQYEGANDVVRKRNEARKESDEISH